MARYLINEFSIDYIDCRVSVNAHTIFFVIFNTKQKFFCYYLFIISKIFTFAKK